MQIHGTPASLPELHPHREDRWTKTGILWQAASNGNSVGGYAKRSRMLVTEENAHLTWPQESESVAHHGLSLPFTGCTRACPSQRRTNVWALLASDQLIPIVRSLQKIEKDIS